MNVAALSLRKIAVSPGARGKALLMPTIDRIWRIPSDCRDHAGTRCVLIREKIYCLVVQPLACRLKS